MLDSVEIRIRIEGTRVIGASLGQDLSLDGRESQIKDL